MSPGRESAYEPGHDEMYRPPDDRNRGSGGGSGSGGGGGGDQVSLEDLLERLRNALPSFGGKGGGSRGGAGGGLISLIVLLGLALVAVIWLGSGVYTVNPDEQAALRTFGRFTSIQGSGLHWHWPSPIGERNVVAVTQTRRMELGFRTNDSGTRTEVPAESLMITGDENIVDVEAVVQYRIANLQNFLFEVDDPGDPDRGVPAGVPEGRTLRDITETALRQIVGSRPIDDILTVQKEAVQTDTRLKMEELNRRYSMGLDIVSVLLQNVNPPEQVQDAFEDVVRAQEEQQRLINEAQSYENDQIPRARGDAAEITEAAEGFREGRIARAEGEAAGFRNLLEGYQTSQEVTRRRLYLETMEEVLSETKRFVITEDAAGGVLPFLPLDGNRVPIPNSGTGSGSSGSGSGSSSGSGPSVQPSGGGQ